MYCVICIIPCVGLVLPVLLWDDNIGISRFSSITWITERCLARSSLEGTLFVSIAHFLSDTSVKFGKLVMGQPKCTVASSLETFALIGNFFLDIWWNSLHLLGIVLNCGLPRNIIIIPFCRTCSSTSKASWGPISTHEWYFEVEPITPNCKILN